MKTIRTWGYYTVLHQAGSEVKVKELTVEPGQRLSMQRHSQRAEHWFVAHGTATVYTVNRKSDAELLGVFQKHQHIHIDCNEWHQLCNETDQPLQVIEIQYGANCVEEDIERR
jgi:mannose-6-phosphate isomerase